MPGSVQRGADLRNRRSTSTRDPPAGSTRRALELRAAYIRRGGNWVHDCGLAGEHRGVSLWNVLAKVWGVFTPAQITDALTEAGFIKVCVDSRRREKGSAGQC